MVFLVLSQPGRSFDSGASASAQDDIGGGAMSGSPEQKPPGRIRIHPPLAGHCEPVTDVTGVAIRFLRALLPNLYKPPGESVPGDHTYFFQN